LRVDLSITRARDRLGSRRSERATQGDCGLDDLGDSSSIPSVEGPLRRRTARAGLVSVGTQLVSAVLSVAGIAVLSRWLSPEDFGVFALAYVVVGWISTFTESGFSYATIQSQEISHAQASNLFWANLLLGCIACGTLFVLSPGVAWMYGRPELVPVMAMLGIAVLVSCLGLQQLAQFQRRLEFGRIALVTIGSKLISLGTAIAVARSGGGFWALAAQEGASSLSRVALTWVLSEWRPSAPRSGAGTLVLMRLGALKSMAEFIGVLRRSADVFLLGLFCGTQCVGLYSRSAALISTPVFQAIGPISRVAVPALSRVQSDPVRFRSAVRNGVELLGFASLPTCVFVSVAAEPFVGLLLGDQWSDTVALVRVLTARTLVSIVLFPAMSWGFAALGKVGDQLKWSLLALALTTSSVGVGAYFGPLATACVVTGATFVSLLLGFRMAFKAVDLGLLDVAVVLRPSLLASAFAGAGSLAVLAMTAGMSSAWQLLLASLAFGLVYSGSLSLDPSGRRLLLGVLRVLRAGVHR
jgi:O-antigen/teichoic acid export membrane protein